MTRERARVRIRTTSSRRRHALVVSSLLAASLLAGEAGAQSSHSHGSYNDFLRDEATARRAAAKAPPATPESDGLSGGGFYLEADEVIRREEQHHVEASGRVEARYEGRTLRADHVDYDTEKGEVVATGHVQIIGDDGSTEFADKISVDKNLNEGFAQGFATRLKENVRIAAKAVSRPSRDGVTILDHVIYTPCEVCSVNGASEASPPGRSGRVRRRRTNAARRWCSATP